MSKWIKICSLIYEDFFLLIGNSRTQREYRLNRVNLIFIHISLTYLITRAYSKFFMYVPIERYKDMLQGYKASNLDKSEKDF